MHRQAHKTKWTVYYINTGIWVHFSNLESAKVRAFECEGACPVRIIPPIYAEE